MVLMLEPQLRGCIVWCLTYDAGFKLETLIHIIYKICI